MNSNNLITLIAFIFIFVSIVLFGGYYLFTQTNMCVSNPMLYEFGNETSQIESMLNQSSSLKMCAFYNSTDIFPYFCINVKR